MQIPTKMQDKLPNETSYNVSYADEDYHGQYYLNIYFIDVVLLLANITALTADVIILFVIYKTKSWKTPLYMLVINWAVLDILHLVTSPGLFKWYTQLHQLDNGYGFTLQSAYVCLNLAFEFGIIFLLFILIYVDVVKFFKEQCLKILGFIWFSVAVLCLFALIGIANYQFHISVLFSFAMYVIFIIVIIISCITFFVKKRHSDKEFKLKLTLVSVYVCCWTTFALFAVIMVIFGEGMILSKEFVLIMFACGEMNSVANLYILTTQDRTFNIYIYRIFDCRKNKSDDKLDIVYEYQNNEEA